MHEAFFRNPALLFHQIVVHDGDLPCRTAEADETQLQPVLESFRAAGRCGNIQIQQFNGVHARSSGKLTMADLGRDTVLGRPGVRTSRPVDSSKPESLQAATGRDKL